MGRGKSRKQPKQPRIAGSRARTTHEAATGSPSAGSGHSTSQRDGRDQRKIKRSRPLLVASGVLLIVWLAILTALAWHSAN